MQANPIITNRTLRILFPGALRAGGSTSKKVMQTKVPPAIPEKLRVECGLNNKKVLTLQKAVTDIPHETGRETHHEDPDNHPHGAGQTEDDCREEEVPLVEVGLGNVEPKAEGHHNLVDDDGNHDGGELTRVVLESDGNTLEDLSKHI